ncbi:MAG TPA: response regulator [Rhizomicrobium sp.]|nr:response regulator [Rhizomicrobium sp.]
MTKIMIVEDSPTQAESLRAVLEEAGCEVVVAYNAESALAKIDSSLDLVISDIVMPGLSGYELCKRIKAGVYGRNLPVMLLSTLSDPMDIVGGLESGADNFVTKPYSPAQLMERVTNVLENRKMRSSGKLRVGVEVMFLGRNFTINSDKEQILDLLMSTFEDIVRTNRDLQKNRAELAAAKLEIEDYAQGLERRVEERTRELASQKRLLAQAQSMAHVGNWRIHLPSKQCEWSDEMYAIHGVSPEKFTPSIETAMAMVHPDDRANVDKVVDSAIASRLPYHMEYRILRPNGEERYCWAEGFWEQNSEGEITNLVGYCQDVTERKMAERVAKESAARYRHIVESMVSGLVVISDGRFLYVNDAACQIFGVAHPSDVVGKPFIDALAGSNRKEVAAMISRPRVAGEPLFREEKLVRASDGAELDVEISKAALTFAGLPATQLIIRDITEKKALTQQLHQAQKMEVVGQLTGGIAHDFNNLLTVVISNLDMILSGASVNAENRELAEAALAASLRGAELTRQLLAFSRKQALQKQTINPNELVDRTVTMLKRAIAGDIELRTDLCTDLWLSDIDPSQLESAITNLVVNARDAMPKGGAIMLETSNATLDEAYAAANRDVVPGNYAMIAVSDTGSGIPASVLSRVFEPFFTTKEVGKGTGLGLSMVYGFMKQSGGHVKIYSEEGRGTVVRLYLPQSANAPATQAIKPENEMPVGRHERILVVEDDEAVRRAATQQLQELGYTVLEANNAQAALLILQREQVDLLFTDVTMPGGVSGPDLAREAIGKDPALKVLMTSGFTEATMREGESSGKFELLSKPYRRQELAQRVHRVLRGAA